MQNYSYTVTNKQKHAFKCNSHITFCKTFFLNKGMYNLLNGFS